MSDFGVCILAGGEASRLPGKLELDFAGKPLLVRVYENVRGHYPVYISAKGTFGPRVDAMLDAPIIVDRWISRGPLAGLITVFSEVAHKRMFVVAGDAPFAGGDTLQKLRAAWQDSDEAVVAEPLLALYGREAFLESALPIFLHGSGAVKDVIAALRTRNIDIEPKVRTNINTPQDYKRYVKYEGMS